MSGALARSSLLIPVKRGGGSPSVVLPPAGGGIGSCLGVAAHLARRGPVCGIRASGLMPGEDPDHDVAAMVQRYWEVLHDIGTPRLLLGWSLGGALAWELALRYAESGHQPAVVMIDSPAVPEFVSPLDRAALRRTIAGESGEERLIATADAHITAATAYHVEHEYPGPALLISCARENQVHAARWRRMSDSLHHANVDCGHFDVLDGANLPTVVRHLDEFLRTLEEQ